MLFQNLAELVWEHKPAYAPQTFFSFLSSKTTAPSLLRTTLREDYPVKQTNYIPIIGIMLRACLATFT